MPGLPGYDTDLESDRQPEEKRPVDSMVGRRKDTMKYATLFEFAQDSIKLFLEYRDGHGCTEDEAMAKATIDMSDPYIGIELIDSEELKKLKRQASSLPDSIQEALNSGDGIYRP